MIRERHFCHLPRLVGLADFVVLPSETDVCEVCALHAGVFNVPAYQLWTAISGAGSLNIHALLTGATAVLANTVMTVLEVTANFSLVTHSTDRPCTFPQRLCHSFDLGCVCCKDT